MTINACGHDGDGVTADMGDGRMRVVCARCAGTLRPPDVKLLTRKELEKASTDCPACPKCRIKAGTRFEANFLAVDEMICAACGHQWDASKDELAKALYADRAYARLLDMEGVDADEHDRGVTR